MKSNITLINPSLNDETRQMAFVLCSSAFAFIIAFALDLFFSNLSSLINGNGRKAKSVFPPANFTKTGKTSTKQVLKRSSSKSPKKADRRKYVK